MHDSLDVCHHHHVRLFKTMTKRIVRMDKKGECVCVCS